MSDVVDITFNENWRMTTTVSVLSLERVKQCSRNDDVSRNLKGHSITCYKNHTNSSTRTENGHLFNLHSTSVHQREETLWSVDPTQQLDLNLMRGNPGGVHSPYRGQNPTAYKISSCKPDSTGCRKFGSVTSSILTTTLYLQGGVVLS